MKIEYNTRISCELLNLNAKTVKISGPLGAVKVYLGPRFVGLSKNEDATSKRYNCLVLNEKYISKQNIRLLKRLNFGLTVGYRKRIYQSGVWTIMKKLNPKKIKNKLYLFKLGFSHPTIVKIPNHLIFRSRREGQFRTINLYSISYQLVRDSAAQLIQLRKADVYRLNGFRYALPRRFGPRATNIRLKVGKKK
jgi:ribosomal protein L6P/L9E